MSQEDYSIFNKKNDQHTKIGSIAEKILEDETELKTSELAKKVEREGSNLSESYINALLSDGSKYFTENNNLEIEKRPESGGGNLTFFWKNTTS